MKSWFLLLNKFKETKWQRMPRLSVLYFKGERLRERLLDGLREELRLRGRRVRVESSSGRGPETVSIVQNNEKLVIYIAFTSHTGL